MRYLYNNGQDFLINKMAVYEFDDIFTGLDSIVSIDEFDVKVPTVHCCKFSGGTSRCSLQYGHEISVDLEDNRQVGQQEPLGKAFFFNATLLHQCFGLKAD